MGRESSRLSVLMRHAIAGELGLNVTDGECLDFILERRSVTAGDLARRTGLTTGAITSVIRRLVTAGFLRANRDPRDRRRLILSPVAKKVALGADLYAHYFARGRRALAAYSDKDIAVVVSYLRMISGVYDAEIEWISSLRAGGKAAPPRRARRRVASS